MAKKYSTLYGQAPNSVLPQYIYAGPKAERRGQTVLRFAQFTGALTFNASADLNDQLYIAGGFAAGEKVRRITNTRSADADAANDFTFNLGWRLGSATAFASASTGMQATAAFEVAEAAALPIAAASEGDDLVLTAAAGAAEVATVVHSFLVESYLP